MKTGIGIGTAGMLAAGLLVGQMAYAEGRGKGNSTDKQAPESCGCAAQDEGTGENKQERDQVREQFKKQMRERMEKHQEARKQLMEVVRAEEDAQKALAIVREHCVKQHAERSAFHAGEMEKRLERLGERLKNSDMDEARREETLKKIGKEMEERKARAEAHYAKLLANLDALKGKEDLTKKDILDAVQDARPEGMWMHNRDGRPGKERGEEMKRKRDGNESGEQIKQKREGKQGKRVKKSTDA